MKENILFYKKVIDIGDRIKRILYKYIKDDL